MSHLPLSPDSPASSGFFRCESNASLVLAADGTASAFEVKAIGVEDGDFRIFVESLAGGIGAAWVSPYTAINYLLFRIYEAACQLKGFAGVKKVVVLIDETTWLRFDVQLEDKWIDWNNPAFVAVDADWEQFLDSQAKSHPGLKDALAETIRTLDSLEILRQNSQFEFIPVYDLICKS